MKRICAFVLSVAVILTALLSIKPQKAFSMSKEEIINTAELNPMKTGYAKLDKLISDFFAEAFTDDMTVYDKLKACYDYCIYDTTYGKSYDSRKVAVLQKEQGYIAEHDAYLALRGYTFLIGRVGVCNDYSCAFVVLSRALGFDSHVVTGKTNLASGGYTGHMWVNIKIDGVYYTFDPQVECNIAARQDDKKIIYSRFVATDEEMKKKLIYYDREADVALFNGFKKYPGFEDPDQPSETETTVTTSAEETTTTETEISAESDVISVAPNKQGKARYGTDMKFKISVDNPSGKVINVVMGIKEDTPSATETQPDVSDATEAETSEATEIGTDTTTETEENTTYSSEPEEDTTAATEPETTYTFDPEDGTVTETEADDITYPVDPAFDTTEATEPETTYPIDTTDVTDAETEADVTEPSETSDETGPEETEPDVTEPEETEPEDIVIRTDEGEITILRDARSEGSMIRWNVDRTGTYTVYLFVVTDDGYEILASYLYEFVPPYKIVLDGDFLTGICADMTVNDIELNENEVFLDKNREKIDEKTRIGTGFIFVSDGIEYKVFLKGDTDGDGTVSVTDYVLIKKAILGLLGFGGEYYRAADVDGDGMLASTDYILIKMHILDLLDIYT